MKKTLSLCPTCYKKVPAVIYEENGAAWMEKNCDVHGDVKALVEKDFQHFSNFYRFGTMGNNNAIIIHIHDQCNMKCPWCYYPIGVEKPKTIEFYDTLLHRTYAGYSLMFSGGEPTERPDYIEFTEKAYRMGWNPSTITNMINLADIDFFARTLSEAFADQVGNYRFAMSFQHKKNYSDDILNKKLQALENIEKENLKASCLMFSIENLDELDYIKEIYDETRHLYHMLRIRTMFNNWGNKSEKKLFLSELHKAFLDKFSEYCPTQNSRIEQSNIYCLYMTTNEMRDVSLSSAPTVENVDYHLTTRPVFMLAMDLKCYPVPLAQIHNQGISEGWKDGFKLGG